MRLRPATPADADAVAALFAASFALLDFLPRLHTTEEDRAYFRAAVGRGGVTLAEDDAGVDGFLNETPGWVEHLYVRPDRLRRGVGSALLRLAQSRQPALRLWCFQKNLRGRAFYEAHEFRAARFTYGAHNEEREPDVLYVWPAPGG